MKPLFLTCLYVFASLLVTAQNEDSAFISKISNEILLNSQAYNNLRVLTKTIGGRLAGSPQMVKAEQWGLAALKAAGSPDAYMQECMVPHWIRGGKDVAKATYGSSSKTLDVVALGNSTGTMKPLKAPVLLIRNFEELERRKDEVKGKIVFYNYPFNATLVKTFQAYGDAGRYRREGPSRAAKYGALAVIVRSLTQSTDNNPHTGSTAYNDSFQKIPAVAIGLHDADWLSKQTLEKNFAVTLHTHGRFLPDTIGHNVIGEIKGSALPAEFITVGGHLDSWDNCEGAHDDGAGCVQTIEILRAFTAMGYKPRKTIRFVLFANEENGLRGGNKYAEAAKEKGERH
ncbi:MAG: M20/M25/M40 family metallo-hydrolase, partial [Chitinophagaceae bacterium]